MKITQHDFPTLHRFPVHWGDMDSAQHVNNLVYLRWAETARVLYFKAMGVNTRFAPGDTGAILAYQDCKYTFPMTYPDTALVGVRTVEVNEDRFTLETAIFSEHHNRLAAITRQVIVPYDYGALRKAPMPDAWREGIRRADAPEPARDK
ncbi:acyl-CoA thioester hydrolase [Lewinella marina]|uniref:Acyl-ACP thioesterase n=1 Tax=Neolewinella marina TaxID=438751 RepID=A0A2G0CCS2_9BACT|nr:thioesterase family protein [Neolewinella marina]NJB87579.1 acyl-CoA thioester hydrolase [Neolewinella marina]PHK97730.1 acyl-ACP thioesterase [Neolewinella marina]